MKTNELSNGDRSFLSENPLSPKNKDFSIVYKNRKVPKNNKYRLNTSKMVERFMSPTMRNNTLKGKETNQVAKPKRLRGMTSSKRQPKTTKEILKDPESEKLDIIQDNQETLTQFMLQTSFSRKDSRNKSNKKCNLDSYLSEDEVDRYRKQIWEDINRRRFISL